MKSAFLGRPGSADTLAIRDPQSAQFGLGETGSRSPAVPATSLIGRAISGGVSRG